MFKRILIIGDAGRGKSTFAAALSKKLGIPTYSTDDFFYITKFTVINDRQKSVEQISKIYAQDSWIVEGTTRRLIEEGIGKAEIIYYLKFKSIFPQYFFLIKRKLSRSYESWKDLWKLLVHVTKRRLKKGYGSYKIPIDDMLAPHAHKVTRLYTHKEIHNCLEKS